MTDSGTNAQTPAGWYPDANGVMRWWDGTKWTEQTQYPNAGTATQLERPRLPEGTKVDTVWTWIVALASFATIPFVFMIDMRGFIEATLRAVELDNPDLAVEATLAFFGSIMLISLVSLVATVLTIIAAYRDHKHLVSVGVQRPFHWAFSFLILVIGIFIYLIGRHVVLRKVTRTAGWPLWIHLALLVASFVGGVVWFMTVMQTVTFTVI